MLKLSLVAITGALLCGYLKYIKSEYTSLAALAAGLLLLSAAFPYISPIITVVTEMSESAGIEPENIKILFKVVSAAYITQFSADICRDCEQSALASKLEMCGRAVIVFISIPLFISLFCFLESVV